MIQAQPLDLGIALILTGLAGVLLVWGLLRLVPRFQPPQRGFERRIVPVDVQQHQDAVFLVGVGGRIEHINQAMRDWFDVPEDDLPDLERLARRVRPSDDFMEICAAEGQARFSINGKLVEGFSYRLPDPSQGMLVTLRRVETNLSSLDQGETVSGSILKVITDFSQNIAAVHDLPGTIRAILVNVNRLVPSDILEVKVMDVASDRLVAYRFVEEEGTVERVDVSQFGEYERVLAAEQKALWIPDTHAPSASARYSSDPGRMAPMRSYLGVPLIAGPEFVGTLEVGIFAPEGFAREDLDMLEMIKAPAAVALRNAQIYEGQQKLSDELRGLAALLHAAQTMDTTEGLYARLVSNLSALFPVNVLGFLRYDAYRHTLSGRAPFYGLPATVVDIYKTSITPGSPAETLIASNDLILSPDASSDPRWQILGLSDIAQAASLRETVLAPLMSAGRFLGYLQFSNWAAGVLPGEEDLRLIRIIANQVSTIIENATLAEEARERTRRTEALQHIIRLMSTAADLDDALRAVMEVVGQTCKADSVALFLYDEQQGALRTHMRSLYGVPTDLNDPLAKLYITPSQFKYTVTGSQKPFISGSVSQDRRVLRLYRPLIRRAGVESAIVVPLTARNRGMGEMMLSSRSLNAFTEDDMHWAASVASQIALAVDATSMSGVNEERLRQRAMQLSAIARMVREFSSTAELSQLLHLIHEETLRVAGTVCSAVCLLEKQAAGGFKVVNTIGHDTPFMLSDVDERVLSSGDALIIPDLAQSDDTPPHEGVRGLIVAPIAHQGEVVGLMSLHASEAGVFTESLRELVETLSVQAAIALINSQRFNELTRRNESLRRRSDSLDKLIEITEELKAERTVEDALTMVGKAIRESTPFQIVLFSTYEPQTGMLRRIAGLGMSAETLEALKSRQQPWTAIAQLMKPGFRVGQGYFVPVEQSPVVSADAHIVTVISAPEAKRPNAWDPDDLLIYPLYDEHGEPLGLLSLDSPRDGQRPEQATLEILDLLAIQASVTLANVRRMQLLRGQVQHLTEEVERQKSLLSVTQSNLPMLLRKDLSQTLSIAHLSQRAERVRASLSMADALSRQLDFTSALMALGSEILAQFNMQAAIVAEETLEGPRILHTFGNIPRNVNPEALFGQRNPLRAVLQSGETLVVESLDENQEWNDTALLTALRARAFVCLPVIIKGKPVAAVLAVNPEPLPPLPAEDREVYAQLSHQISVTLQNLSLLNEQRRRLQEVNLLLDFSRQLSGLNPQNIVKSLLENALRVVVPAHAGAVLLWDANLGLLTTQVAANYADDESARSLAYRPGEGLPGRVFVQRMPYRVDEVRFAVDYNLTAENLIRYRKATGGRLPVANLIIPIQTSDNILGVLVLENFNTPGAFKSDDEAILLSLTQQVALSLENVRLVQATQQRAAQLQALNDVASTIASSIKRDELIASLLDQFRTVIPYDTGILWMRSEGKMVVAGARGFEDAEQRIGLSVDIADSVLLNQMITQGRCITVPNVREDPRFSAVVEARYLSWMGVPLIAKGKTIGVVALEKAEDHFYTPDLVQLATTFAGQAAVALENASLFEESVRRAAELDERSKRLALLNRFSAALSGSLNADQVLRLTAEQLLQALNASRAWIVVLDKDNRAFLQNTIPDDPRLFTLRALPASPFFAHFSEAMGVFTTANIASETRLGDLRDLFTDVKSLMVVPVGTPPHLHAIFVQSEQEQHFTSTEIELARTLCNQASIALQNADLYQSTLATAQRLAILNEVSAQIGVSLNPDDIYRAVHAATARLMPVDAFVIALLDEEQGDIDGAYIFDSGQRIMGVRLPLGQGLSGQVIATGETILSMKPSDLGDRQAVLVGNDEAEPNSIVAVPMIVSGGKVIGAMSAQSYAFNAYTNDDLQVLSTLANQAAVAVQNGRLFAQTQNFAATLEQRVIERTAELQREQRNTETLLSILTEVSASLDLDRALSRTLSLLNEAIGAEQGTIMLLQPEDNLLHYRAGYGYASGTDGMGAGSGRGTTLKVGEGLAGW
ncbi:MAG: GAF domain-containing protein, partial [Anaerolineales bacterium]